MPPLVLHHLDVLNNEYVSGWCFNRVTQWRPTILTLSVDGKRIGVAQCNEFREDVKRAGLHKSGNCGFTFVFDQPLDLLSTSTLRIDTELRIKNLATLTMDTIPSVLETGRTTLFMHIPKTAGTSFNNYMHSWFGFKKWHSHIEVLDIDQQQALALPDTYIAGHLPLYRINQILPDSDNTDLHSIIRQPSAQLHSHLAWIKGIGVNPESGFFEAHNPVVRELALRIQKMDISDPTDLSKFVASLDGFELDFFDNIQTRYFLDYRPEHVSQVDLDRALKNLQLFSTISLTEQYQKGLDNFAAFYGRKPEIQETQHNLSRVTPLFDTAIPEIQVVLQPLIQYDQQLYNHIASDQEKP